MAAGATDALVRRLSTRAGAPLGGAHEAPLFFTARAGGGRLRIACGGEGCAEFYVERPEVRTENPSFEIVGDAEFAAAAAAEDWQRTLWALEATAGGLRARPWAPRLPLTVRATALVAHPPELRPADSVAWDGCKLMELLRGDGIRCAMDATWGCRADGPAWFSTCALAVCALPGSKFRIHIETPGWYFILYCRILLHCCYILT